MGRYAPGFRAAKLLLDSGRIGEIEICEEPVYIASKNLEFSRIPVMIANHNVRHELEDFVSCIDRNEQCLTDVYQGTRTVAFAEAAINSAATGMPISYVCEF
ncbi:MAG: hypothetical protein PHT33_09720 [bacterium]|nr:hypothetical protein [bacterium]